ncbi:hypothetical protein [Natronosalvus halobius]|uniref:hypothetical protein n=1 Tax=Natronosalvus halobius TaxID=2953746 RepID=UPI00209FD50D|nr:hypothetical protein [Natronosalvus halobius]USZ71650.1 hypothetical protein NGM15_16560 [Natronosalvus halobius]
MTERWQTLFDRGESFTGDLETIQNELARRRESADDDPNPGSGSKPEPASKSEPKPAPESTPEDEDA